MENEKTTGLNYCYNCMKKLEEGEDICPECGHDNRYRHNTNNTLPEGSILNGKYLIGKILGQGGFGITYLGVNLLLNVRVAIKEYFPAGVGMRAQNSIRVVPVLSDSNGFEKGCREFQSEAQTLTRFNSPNIVRVRDYFHENGTACLYRHGLYRRQHADKGSGRLRRKNPMETGRFPLQTPDPRTG